MHYLKSFVMTLSLFVLTVPVIQAGDVEDINSMVKKEGLGDLRPARETRHRKKREE